MYPTWLVPIRRRASSSAVVRAQSLPQGELEDLFGHQSHFVEGVADEEKGDFELGEDLFQVGYDLELKPLVKPGQRLVHQQ